MSVGNRNFRNIKYNAKNKARFNFNEITNVRMDFGRKPGSERSNIIPAGGINRSNPPTVTVFGSPGASFEVSLTETKLIELTDGGFPKSGGYTSPSDIVKDAGRIPNMPDSVVTIPASGKYTFKLPSIEKLTITSGWKEFEMVFKAKNRTVIRDTASRDYSNLKYGESENAVLTNTLYQYTPSRITTSATIGDGWGWVTNYNISNIEIFGNIGSKNIGRPYLKTSKVTSIADSKKNIKFELRVFKTGTFSFTNKVKPVYRLDGKTVSHYVVDTDVFEPSVEDNDDIVILPKLRVHIGNGLGDTDSRYATVVGRLKYVQFGKRTQNYNIDLTKIFNHV